MCRYELLYFRGYLSGNFVLKIVRTLLADGVGIIKIYHLIEQYNYSILYLFRPRYNINVPFEHSD